MEKNRLHGEIRSILDESQSIVVIINSKKEIEYINDFGAKLLGYQREEVIGKNWFKNFIPRKNRDEINSVFDNLIEGYVETFRTYFSPILTQDGTERIIFWKNSLLKDETNRITGTLSLGDDITDRKELEKQLRSKMDIREKIIESSPVGITIMDENGNIIFANDHAEKILNLSKTDITQRTYNTPDWEITDYNGNIFPNERLPFSIVKRTKKPVFHIKHAIKGKKGEMIYLDVNATPLFDDENNFTGVIAIIEDVTEEILAKREIEKSEYKLKRSEKMYRALFERSPLAILLLDDEKVINCNRKTLEMYGCDIYEDMIGKTPWKFSPKIQPNGKPSKEKALSMINKTTDEKTQTFYWISQRKDGSTFHSEINLSLIKIDHKEIIQAIIKDTSELKRAYNRAEFYKDLFVHDINNILQGNLTGIQLIENYFEEQSLEDKQIWHVISLLKNQVTRGARLVSNIRKLSEIESTEINEKTLTPVNALNCLNNVIEGIQQKVEDKELQISIDSPQSKVFVNADKYLKDIFENLILNAIRHNQHEVVKVEIKISLEKKDHRFNFFKFSFIDNARGIETSQKQTIFLRDYKDLEHKKDSFGLGLGLTLVKRIINRYGGEIWVDDKVPGDYTQGSKFQILLPEANSRRNV